MGWTVRSLPALSEREPVASMRRTEQDDKEGVWAHLGTLRLNLLLSCCNMSNIQGSLGSRRGNCPSVLSGIGPSEQQIEAQSISDFNVTKPHGAMQHHRKKTKTFHQPVVRTSPQPRSPLDRSKYRFESVLPQPATQRVTAYMYMPRQVLRATRNSPGIGLNGSLTVFCSSQTQDQSARRLFPASPARTDGQERRGISTAPPCSHHQSIDLLHGL